MHIQKLLAKPATFPLQEGGEVRRFTNKYHISAGVLGHNNFFSIKRLLNLKGFEELRRESQRAKFPKVDWTRISEQSRCLRAKQPGSLHQLGCALNNYWMCFSYGAPTIPISWRTALRALGRGGLVFKVAHKCSLDHPSM